MPKWIIGGLLLSVSIGIYGSSAKSSSKEKKPTKFTLPAVASKYLCVPRTPAKTPPPTPKTPKGTLTPLNLLLIDATHSESVCLYDRSKRHYWWTSDTTSASASEIKIKVENTESQSSNIKDQASKTTTISSSLKLPQLPGITKK